MNLILRTSLAIAFGCTAFAVHADVDCSGTTPIYEIQGASHVSIYDGVEVETCGVVTAVGFDHYYMQDPIGDDDARTSDGIFVFQFGAKPAVGDFIRVRDTVSEFIPGGAGTGNLSITQLSFPEILQSSAGHSLPEPIVIGADGFLPPKRLVISADEVVPAINLQNADDAAANNYDPRSDGIDFYESAEGMLVTVRNPVAVSAIRQFGTFSAEVFTVAESGAAVGPQGALNSRGGINLQAHPDNFGDQNPERIQIQFDGTLFGSTSYPEIQVGDQLADVTGVVGYSFGNYEVNVIGPVVVTSKGLVPEVAKPLPESFLSIASYNVLNLSAVARDDAQRELVGRHIAVNLASPDIVALQEIQDNNGDIGDCSGGDVSDCSGVLDASETLASLAAAIVAAGGPSYEYATVDPLLETTDDNRDNPDVFGGISLGNIRNAFLYNPERVSLDALVGLTRDELADRGVTDNSAFDTSRDPLMGVFTFATESIVVVNNHFSSRFGSTPIFGGPQPFVQAGEEAREAQSAAMNQLANSLLEEGYSNVVIAGDLNTFEFTNDLASILPGEGRDRILANLTRRNPGDDDYTFIFDGNSQTLDHMFVSIPLARRALYEVVHVNNDFPRRFSDVVGSDHEPVLGRFFMPSAQ